METDSWGEGVKQTESQTDLLNNERHQPSGAIAQKGDCVHNPGNTNPNRHKHNADAQPPCECNMGNMHEGATRTMMGFARCSLCRTQRCRPVNPIAVSGAATLVA